MNYRLICIDMDGTLLDHKGEVSIENKKALKKAYDAGVIIALTTGRGCKGAALVLEDIGIEGPVIGGNGGQIMLPGEEAPLYLSTMTKENLTAVHKALKSFDIEIYYMTDWGIITDFKLPPDHVFYKLNDALPEKAKFKLEVVEDIKEGFVTYQDEILKAMCVKDEAEEQLEEIRLALSKLQCFEVVKTWHNTLEIMNKGTSKGKGVNMLATHLDIPKEAIMCIGDSENDLPMFEVAGLSVAMGNAFDSVKERADVLTADYTQSGVAKAIERYVFED